MSVWTLAILVTATWVLWAVGGVIELWADKLERKRAPDAGFSPVPIIPLFPIVAVYIAGLVDKLFSPWGTRLVGGFHALLVVVFVVAIVRAVHRGRSANRPAV